MIDIHSHIIPNVDDGARSWQEALAMCRMAWKDGIQGMVATPHALNGVYLTDGNVIAEQIVLLKEKLREENIGLEIYQGAEVYCSPDLPLILTQDPSLTFNSSGRYFLLEFPHSIIPPHSEELLFQLGLRNFIPIIVHPERNLHVQSNVGLLEKLVNAGAFCQVTAMSFTGGFGTRVRDTAFQLLKKGLVHAVASDAHNPTGRPPIMSKARQVVSECLDEGKARELFEGFPRKILKGEVLSGDI